MKDVIKLKRHDEFIMRFSMGKLYKTICETLLDKGVLKIERVDDHDEVRFAWELKGTYDCFSCDHSYIGDDDLIICELDGRSRDHDHVCEKWI